MTIGRPAGNVDASLVAAVEVIQSATLGARLCIVEEAGLVLSNRHVEAAIGAVPHAVDEVAVIRGCAYPLERRTLVPRDGKVFSASRNTEGLGGPVIASGDGLGVASDGAST